MEKLKTNFSLKWTAVTLAVIIVLGYGLARSYNLLAGPEIELESLKDGETLNQEFLIIRGQAKRIATLFLNGRQIFTDEVGRFKEPFLLFPGYNAISLRAHDKFGRELNKQIIIINQSS